MDSGRGYAFLYLRTVATSESPVSFAHVASAKPRIAVFDDDADFSRLVKVTLQSDFLVLFPKDQEELFDLVSSGGVAVVLLDIGLPGDDGISIAQRLRYLSEVPIVFLTGYSSEDMIVKGLNIGAADYVTKPFQSDVLRARIRNVLRHRAERPASGRTTISFANKCTFDLPTRVLQGAAGRRVALTETEALILLVLAEAENQVVSRDDLFRQLHGREWDQMSREIDVHVSRLRGKLGDVCGIDNPLSSVRGVGYCLTLDRN